MLCLLALRVREGYRLSVTTVTSNDAQVRVPQVASLSQHTFYAVLSIHAMIQFLLLLISLDFCVLYLYAVQKQFRYILCGVIHEQQNHFIKRGTSQPDDETKSNTISSTAVRE